MPAFNRTGPIGAGSRTGRGCGACGAQGPFREPPAGQRREGLPEEKLPFGKGSGGRNHNGVCGSGDGRGCGTYCRRGSGRRL